MSYKSKKFNLLAGFFVAVLIFVFFYKDEPNLMHKLAAMNMQEFSLSNNFVVILAYILAFLCLLFAAFSKSIVKYPIFILITLSTLFSDVFYSLNGKVLEYPDFIVLYQAKANFFDALDFYTQDILKATYHIAIILVAFIIAPVSKKLATQKLIGGGGYHNLYYGVWDRSWGMYCQKRWCHQ